ncbi:DUF4297 domain-containing protein [Pseudomonas alliivorans]|nr:DUF4297 domain-containing protein [Pseudomonas alliivorans]
MSNSNPLLAAQRETSGASTFEKYDYQYHWALFRALDEYSKDSQFVVFVELHEDVVVGSSLNSEEATFEFNQVKDIDGSAYTAKKIVYRSSGKGDSKKNSIIGKMLQGVEGKSFKDKISQLNLVATCGFSLKLKDETLKLSLLRVGDLHEDCVAEIESALDKEFGKKTNLPVTLSFIRPELPTSGFNHYVISKIADVVDRKHSGALCSPQTIYRVLMDDLRRKGVVVYDYREWDALLKNKGLTNLDVDKVAMANIQKGLPDALDRLFSDICLDLGAHAGQRNALRRALGSYESNKKYQKTTVQIMISECLQGLASTYSSVFDEQGGKIAVETIENAVPSDIKSRFIDGAGLRGAIIYELILKVNE